MTRVRPHLPPRRRPDGGVGNITTVRALTERALARAPFAPYCAGVRDAYHFAGPAETRARLEAADVAAVQT